MIIYFKDTRPLRQQIGVITSKIGCSSHNFNILLACLWPLGFLTGILVYSTQSLSLAGPEHCFLTRLPKFCSGFQRLSAYVYGLLSSTALKLCKSPEGKAGHVLKAFSCLPKDAALFECKPEILRLQPVPRNGNSPMAKPNTEVSSLFWSDFSLES